VNEPASQAQVESVRNPARNDRSVSVNDSGVSLVEILVSIVLLGTVVIATLTAIRTSVIGTRIERDHSKAQQWLQSAVGIIEDVDFGDCSSVERSGDYIRDAYQAEIDYDEVSHPSGAKTPYGFADGQIIVYVPDVWDGNEWVAFADQSQCLDDELLRQQRVKIEVISPDGTIVETVEMVKRDQL
jgi:hypothetical protein